MTRLRSLITRSDPGPDGPPGRREWRLLALILAVGLFGRLIYLGLMASVPLLGDAPAFDHTARLFADGKLFWGDVPWGEDHVSAWKAPGYWLWLGLIYSIFGASSAIAGLIQLFVCGTAVILLTWLLARRLFNHWIALVAATIAAVYPNMFQFEEMLFVEAVVLPMTLVLALLVFTGTPSLRRTIWIGVLLGALMLFRPTSFYLLPGLLAAWWVRGGFGYAVRTTSIAVGCMLLVIAPWTIRNAIVFDAFIPISLQDAAVAGTFNDESANDPNVPYGWRPAPERDVEVLDPPSWEATPSEPEIREELISRAREYISDNPDAVPKAIFWNGITRFWDIRRPSNVLADAPFEGRRRSVASVGLAMYYILAPLALYGLWRIRHRHRDFAAFLVFSALAAIFVFSIASTTRYRVPFEPFIVILACAGILPLIHPATRRGYDEPVAESEEVAEVSAPPREPAAAPG